MGFRGNALRWIAEWLEDRKQSVHLKGHRSGWTEVRSGVLQGYVFGQLLFTIFMTDEEVLREFSKFADDTKYLAKSILLMI